MTTSPTCCASRRRRKPRKQSLRPQVEEALARAGLLEEVKDNLDHPALRLSGGQQQRLCIARALAANPEVLLLDEPCSALDPQSTKVIEDLIVKLREEVAVVIVTHNLQQAHRIADHVAFMYLGELVEYAPTQAIFGITQGAAHAGVRQWRVRLGAWRRWLLAWRQPLAGCTTTQHEAQRERLDSARQRAALNHTRVDRRQPGRDGDARRRGARGGQDRVRRDRSQRGTPGSHRPADLGRLHDACRRQRLPELCKRI